MLLNAASKIDLVRILGGKGTLSPFWDPSKTHIGMPGGIRALSSKVRRRLVPAGIAKREYVTDAYETLFVWEDLTFWS